MDMDFKKMDSKSILKTIVRPSPNVHKLQCSISITFLLKINRIVIRFMFLYLIEICNGKLIIAY